MKKSVIIAVLGMFVAATAAFAQTTTVTKTDNLLWTADSVIPAHGVIIGDSNPSPMVKGKAPSGKDAVIASVQDNGGLEYRFRIDFAKPLNIKGYKKLIIEWEALDDSMAKGANMNASVFTLNKDDNKLDRAGKLDFSKRDTKLDKKSILMAHGGFQKFTADFRLSGDCQGWTDTTVDGSTKKVTAVELFVGGLGGDIASRKGMAITNVWFE